MADNVKDWSPDPNDNDAAPPFGAPENATFIADCNNIDRQIMADARSQFEDQGWFNWGHVATNTGATTFTLAGGDYSAIYHSGRKLRIEDATTLYDTVDTVSYVNPNTIVTVVTGGLTAAMNGQTVSTGLPDEAYGLTEIQSDLDGKMDLVPPATPGNAMILDTVGQGVDAAVPLATLDITDVAVTLPSNNNTTSTALPVELQSKAYSFFNCYLIPTASAGSGFIADAEVASASTVGSDGNGWSFQVTDTNIVTALGDGNTGIIGSAGTKVTVNATNFSAIVRFVTVAQVVLP
jgi:hypothetical protein